MSRKGKFLARLLLSLMMVVVMVSGAMALTASATSSTHTLNTYYDEDQDLGETMGYYSVARSHYRGDIIYANADDSFSVTVTFGGGELENTDDERCWH